MSNIFGSILKTLLLSFVAVCVFMTWVTVAKAESFNHDGYYAIVTNVTPNQVYVNDPQQLCEKQIVRVPRQHEGDVIGGADGLIGGIVGGVIGNQFGGGDGKTAMTALGAIIGNRMATAGKPEYVDRTETVCRTIERKVLRTVDYSVELKYNGVYWNFIMKNEPKVGDRIRVRAIDVQD